MEKDIKRLGKLFSKIDGFASTPKRWRNIALAQEAFESMRATQPATVASWMSLTMWSVPARNWQTISTPP